MPAGSGPDALRSLSLPALPLPVSNNAVAGVAVGGRNYVFSFFGLGAGKTWRDTRKDAWVLETDSSIVPGNALTARWKRIPDLPGPGGRLAATAVSAGNKVYVFGGYTVAGDGSEKSVPLVHALDPESLASSELSSMPVPVDDTVSLVYRDRYVYLISGWHDTDNVNLVQVYDTHTNSWFEATDFPGPAVFGHAGGIFENRILVCDGVKVVPLTDAKRLFKASPACFLGDIDRERPEVIRWQSIEHYSGTARYRMAAGAAGGKIYFAGGSDNPYNYDGIGYNGVASEPSASVYAYDFTNNKWSREKDLPFSSMDHRGLVSIAGGFAMIGGMGVEREVLARTVFYDPE